MHQQKEFPSSVTFWECKVIVPQNALPACQSVDPLALNQDGFCPLWALHNKEADADLVSLFDPPAKSEVQGVIASPNLLFILLHVGFGDPGASVAIPGIFNVIVDYPPDVVPVPEASRECCNYCR